MEQNRSPNVWPEIVDVGGSAVERLRYAQPLCFCLPATAAGVMQKQWRDSAASTVLK